MNMDPRKQNTQDLDYVLCQTQGMQRGILKPLPSFKGPFALTLFECVHHLFTSLSSLDLCLMLIPKMRQWHKSTLLFSRSSIPCIIQQIAFNLKHSRINVNELIR